MKDSFFKFPLPSNITMARCESPLVPLDNVSHMQTPSSATFLDSPTEILLRCKLKSSAICRDDCPSLEPAQKHHAQQHVIEDQALLLGKNVAHYTRRKRSCLMDLTSYERRLHVQQINREAAQRLRLKKRLQYAALVDEVNFLKERTEMNASKLNLLKDQLSCLQFKTKNHLQDCDGCKMKILDTLM